MKKIRKAVVPVAGYGTRFLPATKAMPKEMLPVVDKPVIQYVVEELVEAGIEIIVFVTSWHKRSIEDHFDRHLELENKLEKSGKSDQVEQIRKISEMAEFIYIRQKEMRGNGDAILTAKSVIGDEPFVVCWGDEFMTGEPNKTKQLIEAYEKYQSTIMAAFRTNRPEDANRYGFAKGQEIEQGTIRVDEFIEKPGQQNLPSDLAIIGGYVFPPEIFEALESIETAPGKELVFVDGVNKLRKDGLDAYAVEIKSGKYYDCGNITEYLKTNVELALSRKDINGEFSKFLIETVNKLR